MPATDSALEVQAERYINAEPGIVPLGNQKVPMVLMSFGGETGPIVDRAISIGDARDLTIDLLKSLSFFGDSIATAMCVQLGLLPDNENSESPSSEEGSSEYDDGYGDCGCGG